VLALPNQNVGNVNFGNRRGSPLSGGTVFFDDDGNGIRHPFEVGLAGVNVYADTDGDSRFDLGEPSATTGADGTYKLTLSTPGTYFVRQSVPPGYVQTFPANNAGHQVTVVSGTLNVTFDFGNNLAEDWGDAPATFPTLAANDGAVHGVLPGFYLGGSVDVEANGNPSAAADGDDVVPQGTDDEDGVVFVKDGVETFNLFPNSQNTVRVRVNLKERVLETVQGRTREIIRTDNSPGRLHAWLDFNRDGDWNDPGEKIFDNLLLNEGVHDLTYQVPANASPGLAHARFRYGYDNVLGPGGRSIAGEVEDYQIRILGITPDAIDDAFTVDQNTSANILLVLANDIPSAAGPLSIISVGPTTNGGTVLISPDSQSLRYTPRTGFIGNDAFNYTVRDPAGAIDTARVSITVLPALAQPVAIDDSVTVNENSTGNEINVLANDLSGRFPPVGIVSFTPPANGVITVDNRGTTNPSDDVLRYTPNAGFGGTDIFQYTIEDATNQQSTATVTVHVQPGDASDDLVAFRLELTDTNNNPIAALGIGESFKLRVFVDDLRGSGALRGVGAAYLDVLFPFNLVALNNTINFGPDYQNARSGNINTPGLINEVGALQTGADPLGPDEVLLFEIGGVATGAGLAQFVGDPADLISENPGMPPDHDTVFFEPPNNVSIRQIRYGSVSIDIVGAGGRPQAIDNLFNVPLNSVNLPLDVLANDVEPNNPPLRITAVGTPNTTTFVTPNGGQVSIGPNGLQLVYTPRNGFVGSEQFSYTVTNNAGLTSSAEVTVQVGAAPKSVSLRIDTTNAQGQHIYTVQQGQTFQVRVFVQDARTNPPNPNLRGVFAAYLDLLYNGGLVSTITDVNTAFGFQLQFGPEYPNGTSASNALPNLINELGAFQASFDPLGGGELLLATINFRANQAGVANFVGDPADISPLHDTLLFDPSDAAVPISNIGYRTASITIVGAAAEGEFRFQNPRDRYDVNNDGNRSAMDALVVVNRLNNGGSNSLLASGEGEGEGEAGSVMYYDVNGDNMVSPIDVLQIVNRLNSDFAGGEGESAAPDLLDAPTVALAAELAVSDDRLQAISIDVGPPETSAVPARLPIHSPRAILPPAGPDRPAVVTHDRLFADLERHVQNSAEADVDSLLAEDVLSVWRAI
jgi:hypothetical protein